MKTILLYTVLGFMFLGRSDSSNNKTGPQFKIHSLLYLGEKNANLEFVGQHVKSTTFRGLDSFTVVEDTLYFFYHEEYFVNIPDDSSALTSGSNEYLQVDTTAVLKCLLIQSDSSALAFQPVNDVALDYFKFLWTFSWSLPQKSDHFIDGWVFDMNSVEKEKPDKIIRFKSHSQFIEPIAFDTLYLSYSVSSWFCKTQYDLRLTQDGQFYVYEKGSTYSNKPAFKDCKYSLAHAGKLSVFKMDSIQTLINRSGIFKYRKDVFSMATHTPDIHFKLICKNRTEEIDKSKTAYSILMQPLLEELMYNTGYKNFPKTKEKICIPTSYREELQTQCKP